METSHWSRRTNNQIGIADELRKISLKHMENNEDHSFDSNSSSSSLFLNLPQTNDEFSYAAQLRAPLKIRGAYSQDQTESSSSSNVAPSSSSSSSASSIASSPDITSNSSSSQAEPSSFSPDATSHYYCSQLALSMAALNLRSICEIHNITFANYCQTCNVPMCKKCRAPYHKTHVTVTIKESLEIARHESMKVFREIATTLQEIDRDLGTITMEYSALNDRAKQTTQELEKCWLLLNVTVDDGRRKLFQEIENARIFRKDILKEKIKSLKNCQKKLINLFSVQQLALTSTNTTNNPFHLRVANGKAIGVTFEVEETRKSIMETEESWMGYSSSEKPLLDALSSFGSMKLNNPGPIGDRRMIRGRSHNTWREHLPKALPQCPQGRPIASSLYRVIVWSEKPNCSIFYPPPIKIIGKNTLEPEHPDNLCRPWGVACDKDNNIFVADRSNNRILVFRENGSIIRKIGSYGSGQEQFNRPAGITIDERRRIIVADKDNHRIQILTLMGNFLLEFGKKGSDSGHFNYPWDVAANTACEIVVSDTRNHRIQLFSPEGIFLRKFGMDSTFGAFKLLDSPRGVTFTPEGNVILTDFNAHRILCVDYRFVNAKVLNCEGGMRPANNFHRPQGVIVDDDGNILVSDSRGYRIMVFNKFGAFLNEFGKQGEGIDEVDRPSGIALMTDGRIVFVDFGNNRVVIR
ncbi:E3 ubiquitin-protein ligase TRIM71-like isoform X2 [Leptopilina boulardi]|nr:E3 ubiquitin-protein ligase TRIM71-like isoform X2 [Leptopilina boulardi]